MKAVSITDYHGVLCHVIAGVLSIPVMICGGYLHLRSHGIGTLEIVIVGIIVVLIVWLAVSACRSIIGVILAETVGVETLLRRTCYEWNRISRIEISQAESGENVFSGRSHQSLRLLVENGESFQIPISELQIRQVLALLESLGRSHLVDHSMSGNAF